MHPSLSRPFTCSPTQISIDFTSLRLGYFFVIHVPVETLACFAFFSLVTQEKLLFLFCALASFDIPQEKTSFFFFFSGSISL